MSALPRLPRRKSSLALAHWAFILAAGLSSTWLHLWPLQALPQGKTGHLTISHGEGATPSLDTQDISDTCLCFQKLHPQEKHPQVQAWVVVSLAVTAATHGAMATIQTPWVHYFPHCLVLASAFPSLPWPVLHWSLAEIMNLFAEIVLWQKWVF